MLDNQTTFKPLHPDIPYYYDCENDYNFDCDCSDYANCCETGSLNDYYNYNYGSIVVIAHDSHCLVDIHFGIDSKNGCNAIRDLDRYDYY